MYVALFFFMKESQSPHDFYTVLSWREDASAQKGKNGISRAKLEIFSNLSNSRSGCIHSLDYIKSIARQTSIFIGSLCSASNSDSRTYRVQVVTVAIVLNLRCDLIDPVF